LLAVVLLAAIACGGRGPGKPPTSRAPAPAATADEAPRPDPLSEASIVADLAWLTDPARRGRGSLSTEARAVADWIADELRAAGYEPTLQEIAAARGQVNVIAVKPAREAGGATVLVSAHYDHVGEQGGAIYPGADDNASGVAVALAVARAIADDAAVAGRVVFVFTGAEEVGLLGALAYVDAPVVPLAETSLAINMDMVGRKLFESALDRDAALGVIGMDDAVAPLAADRRRARARHRDAAHGAAHRSGLAQRRLGVPRSRAARRAPVDGVARRLPRADRFARQAFAPAARADHGVPPRARRGDGEVSVSASRCRGRSRRQRST
jgi:hypothetical protein